MLQSCKYLLKKTWNCMDAFLAYWCLFCHFADRLQQTLISLLFVTTFISLSVLCITTLLLLHGSAWSIFTHVHNADPMCTTWKWYFVLQYWECVTLNLCPFFEVPRQMMQTVQTLLTFCHAILKHDSHQYCQNSHSLSPTIFVSKHIFCSQKQIQNIIITKA